MPLDLSSFFLTTIDFEDAHKIFQTSLSKSTDSNYPPYNIVKVEKNLYRITIALAGFTKDNIEILIEENILMVRNIYKDKNNDRNIYLYKGIATRSFEKKFRLAESVRVNSAFFENGLLNIDLIKINTEKKKPFKIEIKDWI